MMYLLVFWLGVMAGWAACVFFTISKLSSESLGDHGPNQVP